MPIITLHFGLSGTVVFQIFSWYQKEVPIFHLEYMLTPWIFVPSTKIYQAVRRTDRYVLLLFSSLNFLHLCIYLSCSLHLTVFYYLYLHLSYLFSCLHPHVPPHCHKHWLSNSLDARTVSLPFLVENYWGMDFGWSHFFMSTISRSGRKERRKEV